MEGTGAKCGHGLGASIAVDQQARCRILGRQEVGAYSIIESATLTYRCQAGRRMNTMKTKLFIASGLILLVMIFAVQNAATVDIRLLFWDVAFPRSLLIFMMLLIGMVIGWFLRSVFRILKK